MGMGDYIAAKDAAEARYEPDERTYHQMYYEAKDAEEEDIDDRSLMQVYIDSKDAEDDPR